MCYLLDDELIVRYYSRVTRKGQTTIPSVLRKRFGFAEGDRIVFEEAKDGLVLKRAADIEDSAGVLSRFADASEVIDHLLRERRKSFRERLLDEDTHFRDIREARARKLAEIMS